LKLNGAVPLTRCIKMGQNLVVGGNDGSILIWDQRFLSNVNQKFKRSSAEILSLESFSSDQILIGTADGLFFLWDINSSQVTRDFTGSDYEPVYSGQIGGGFVFSCCRDGFLRKYEVPQQST